MKQETLPVSERETFTGILPFDALTLDTADIYLSMGKGYVPDAAMLDLCRAVEKELATICRPRYLYAYFDAEPGGTAEVKLEGAPLNTGRIITPYLADADRYVLFVATAGQEFEAYCQEVRRGGDLLHEYLLDAYGSAIAEATVREVCRQIEAAMQPLGYGTSHPYSPGYCGWSVTGQRGLFSLLPEHPAGVKLSDSCLMYPIKSVSGILATGRNVRKRKYGCELCGKSDCYKNRNKQDRNK